MRKILLCLLFLSSYCAAQTAIDPLSQVRWVRLTGSGAPISTCNSSNYGQPYTDVVAGVAYVCAGSGWITTAGVNPVSGQATGVIPLSTGPTAIGGQSHISDLSGTVTVSEPLTVTGALNGTTANFLGNVTGGQTTGSVNSQINPMAWPYLAKGDCITDDSAAFQSAQTTAMAGSKVMYLPQPPGGCYYIPNFNWQGVSFISQIGRYDLNQVILKGGPGKGVLHPQYDATDVPVGQWPTVFNNPGWSLENIELLVDNSVPCNETWSNNCAYRYPGLGFDDLTSVNFGSTPTQVKTTQGYISCGDVGVGILVAGGGAVATTTTLGTTSTYQGAWGSGTTYALGDVVSYGGYTGWQSLSAGNIGNTPSATGGHWTANTTITISGVTSGSWPAQFGFIQIDSEMMLYEGTLANGLSTITVVRAQGGTSIATHTAGATVTVWGNLSTTIASVSPCWTVGNTSWSVVTLAAAPNQALANVHAYKSVGAIPVTATVGPAGIEFDDREAITQRWASGAVGFHGNDANHLWNFNVRYTTGNSNGAAAFWNQEWGFYGADVRNFNFAAGAYGNLEVCSPFNVTAAVQECGADHQKWTNGNIAIGTTFAGGYPWITYASNGVVLQTKGSATNGPQILNGGYENALHWDIYLPEFEGTQDAVGMRLEGRSHTLHSVTLGSVGTAPTYIESQDSNCLACGSNSTGTLYLDGSNNTFEMNNANTLAVSNRGVGNKLITNFTTNNKGLQIPTETLLPRKVAGMLGMRGADFLRDGNYATPYRWDDLWIWPTDFSFGSNLGLYDTYVQPDATSVTGYVLNFSNAFATNLFVQMDPYGTVGAEKLLMGPGNSIPAGKTNFTVYGKCPGASTFSIAIYAYPQPSGSFVTVGTITTGGSNPATCTTSYQAFSIAVDLSTACSGGSCAGYAFGIGGTTANVFSASWVGVMPLATVYGNALTAAGTAANPTLCTGGQVATGINSDFSAAGCTSVGGSLPNTLGCLQGYDTTPCIIAKVKLTAQTAAIGTTNFYTNATGGNLAVRATVQFRITATGTGTSLTANTGIAGNGTLCTTSAVGVTSTSATATTGCATYYDLLSGSTANYTVNFNSITVAPTYEVYVELERLQ